VNPGHTAAPPINRATSGSSRWCSGRAGTCASRAGCAPLTFSEEGALDFERYSRVEVAVESNATTDGRATQYFVGELRASSGFAQVETAPSPSADLLLNVTVFVGAGYDDEDGDATYASVATFEAWDAQGRLVDSGSESDDSSGPIEAAEDVLDEVALHFIAPYRL
jgi:hypothetical protein